MPFNSSTTALPNAVHSTCACEGSFSGMTNLPSNGSRDGTILSTSNDAQELEPLIKAAIERGK
jgi:hypothetical protein